MEPAAMSRCSVVWEMRPSRSLSEFEIEDAGTDTTTVGSGPLFAGIPGTFTRGAVGSDD
jgi:hypothetical protein